MTIQPSPQGGSGSGTGADVALVIWRHGTPVRLCLNEAVTVVFPPPSHVQVLSGESPRVVLVSPSLRRQRRLLENTSLRKPAAASAISNYSETTAHVNLLSMRDVIRPARGLHSHPYLHEILAGPRKRADA